jgi:hypothetical protein
VPSNDLPLSDPCQDCFLLFTISQGAMLTQDNIVEKTGSNEGKYSGRAEDGYTAGVVKHH